MEYVSYHRSTFLGSLALALVSSAGSMLLARSWLHVMLLCPIVFLVVFFSFIITLWKFGPETPEGRLDLVSYSCGDPRGCAKFPNGTDLCPTALNLRFYFKKMPSRDALKKLANEKILIHERLRFASTQADINLTDPWNKTWTENEIKNDDDLEGMIIEHPPVSSPHELDEILNNLERTNMPKYRPPWIMYRIPSSDPAHVNGALLWRISHEVADGIRLALLGESMCTDEQGNPSDWGMELARGEARKPAGPKPRKKKKATSSLARGMAYLKFALTAGDTQDTVCDFKGPGVPKKAFRTTYRMKPIPMEDVRAASRHNECTINDVLVACVGGAIRKHIEGSCDPDTAKIRAVTALGFPCKKGWVDQKKQMYNDFILIPFPFPVNEATPEGRLTAAKRTFNTIKNSTVPMIFEGLFRLLLKLGLYELLRTLAADNFKAISAVYSNVKGPSEKAYFAGEKVELVEASYHNYTSQFLFLSYVDKLGGTLTCDDRIKDPQKLLSLVEEELRNFLPPEKLSMKEDEEARRRVNTWEKR